MNASRREQLGWCFYDWANSAFPTTVIAVFLGPYLTAIAKAAADASGFVYPLGIPISAGAFFPFVLSLAAAVQVIVLPIVGAIVDYSHRKKQLLGLFAYLGAFATMALYGVQGTSYLLGGLLFVFANLCFGASIVCSNAYLPEVAGPEERDAVSSLGWGIGYLGGGLLLGANLLLVSQAGAIGLTTGDAARISLASAGAWWAVFTLIPLASLRNRQPIKRLGAGERYLSVGFRQLRATLAKVAGYPQTLLFLGAYLLYNDGIQTVIGLTSEFGQEELGLPISSLTAMILMVQFVGLFGNLIFAEVARRVGARRAIMLTLVIWSGALVYAYGFLRSELQFFLLGAVIAIVLGGSQALSRSAFSVLIPRGQEAEYFSVYEVAERGTSWLGPLVFGLILQLTGSFRLAILSIAVFFVAGLVLLTRVSLREGALEAGNEPPARA